MIMFSYSQCNIGDIFQMWWFGIFGAHFYLFILFYSYITVILYNDYKNWSWSFMEMLKVNSNVYYIVLQTKRALSLHMCKCVPVPEWSLHHTE